MCIRAGTDEALYVPTVITVINIIINVSTQGVYYQYTLFIII